MRWKDSEGQPLIVGRSSAKRDQLPKLMVARKSDLVLPGRRFPIPITSATALSLLLATLRVRVVRARSDNVHVHEVTATVRRRSTIEAEDVFVSGSVASGRIAILGCKDEKLHRNAQGLIILGTSEPF